jgi:hypothetical protein
MPDTCVLVVSVVVVVQISQAFKPEKDDVEYAQGRYMLQMLGLQVRRCVCEVLV